MPEIKEKMYLAFAVEEKAAIDEANRSIRFVISTDSPDRDGDVVETDAIAKAIPAFAKNPVCLACHQHRLSDGMPPVVGSWDTDSFKASEHRSEMNLTFATTSLGETWWNLYKNRHVRAVSIGFRLMDGWEEVKDKIRIYHITRIELYEVSCVPVPANPAALSKLKELGVLEVEDKSSPQAPLQKLFDELKRQLTDEYQKSLDEIKDYIDLQFSQVKDLIIPDSEGLAKALLGDAFEQPGGGEDDKNSEQVLTKIEKLFTEFLETAK